MSEIAVFGSINMDLILNVEAFPRQGETIKAIGFEQSPGGKGANQAVAAAKLGGEVSMYGLLGNSHFAKQLKNSLNGQGVNTEKIETRPGTSGIAVVSVDQSGENKIILVPGSNELIEKDYVRKVVSEVSKSNILLVQLETPLEGTIELLEMLPERDGPKVILDPAPAVPLSELPSELIDVLTPNESELEILTKGLDTESGISRILEKGVESLIIKKGDEGAEFISDEKRFSVSAFDITPVDSTGAGDAFNGALATALNAGKGMLESVKFANASGACTTRVQGTQSSIPTSTEVRTLLDK